MQKFLMLRLLVDIDKPQKFQPIVFSNEEIGSLLKQNVHCTTWNVLCFVYFLRAREMFSVEVVLLRCVLTHSKNYFEHFLSSCTGGRFVDSVDCLFKQCTVRIFCSCCLVFQNIYTYIYNIQSTCVYVTVNKQIVSSQP